MQRRRIRTISYNKHHKCQYEVRKKIHIWNIRMLHIIECNNTKHNKQKCVVDKPQYKEKWCLSYEKEVIEKHKEHSIENLNTKRHEAVGSLTVATFSMQYKIRYNRNKVMRAKCLSAGEALTTRASNRSNV